MQLLVWIFSALCCVNCFPSVTKDHRSIREVWGRNSVKEKHSRMTDHHQSQTLDLPVNAPDISNMTHVFQELFDNLSLTTEEPEKQNFTNTVLEYSDGVLLTTNDQELLSSVVVPESNHSLHDNSSSSLESNVGIGRLVSRNRRDNSSKSKESFSTFELSNVTISERQNENNNSKPSKKEIDTNSLSQSQRDDDIFPIDHTSSNWISRFRYFTAQLALFLRQNYPGVRWQNLDNFLKFDPSEYISVEEFFNTFPGTETLFQWDPNGFWTAMFDPSVELAPIVINDNPLKGDLKSVYYRKSKIIKLGFDFLKLMASKIGFELPDFSFLKRLKDKDNIKDNIIGVIKDKI